MKVIEKITLVIYSYIVLLLAFIFCLLVIGWTNTDMIVNILDSILIDTTYTKIAVGVSIVFILLSIKCIFFGGDSKKEKDSSEGILLENESGKLLISKDTIENLVNSVAQGFETTQNVSTKVIFDEENNVKINLTLLVSPNTIIKELSSNLQIRIKEVVKKATDLDIKEININIKNISETQQEA